MKDFNALLMHNTKNIVRALFARHNYNEIEDVLTFFRELQDYCQRNNYKILS